MASFRKGNIKSKIYKIKPKRSIFFRLWFWLIILFLAIIAAATYFLLFYDGIQVKNIVIYGNEKLLNTDIESLVLRDVNHKFFSIGNWEVNSKSIFLVNEKKIEKDALEKFLEIESIIASKNLPWTLNLEIKERKPLGAFCALTFLTQSKETDYECFAIDYSGIIFEPLEKISDDVLIVRQIEGAQQVALGQQVVDQSKISAIYKIQKNLKDNFQISLKEAVIAGPERLNIETSEGWDIYFDVDENFNDNSQITKLNLLLGGELTSEQRANLKYIDLRPKDRAIVCDNDACGA